MKFNYCIGHYWDGNSGSIGCWMTFNSEIFYGDKLEAENTLEYVKEISKNKDWKIFKVIEL